MAASTTTTITTTSTGKPKHRCHREITISSSASSNTDGDSPQPQPTMPPSFSSSPYPYSYPSTFAHFNSALSAGLLSPITMSPPPHSRPTPTLLDMISSETPSNDAVASSSTFKSPPRSLVLEIQGLMHQRVSATLGNQTPGSQFNDPNSSDMTVILTSIDGFSVNISVHRPILVAHSRFFAAKLKQLKGNGSVGELTVEITDCEDVGVYVETLKLMYCRDLRKKLIKEDVPKVLSILKVSAAIGFDAGVLSCLEYLEAAPWSEDEEVEVSSLLSELDLQGACASEVLQRVSLNTTAVTEHSNENEEVFQKLLRVVLEGKDKKARRDMKGLVSKMLRESTHQNNFPKQSLYSACEGCLQKLHHHFLRAASSNLQNVGQIARQADNLRWILDILIDNQIADGFLKKWASLSELSEAHSKVPPVHRFEVSMVTSRLFVGIGKGQILASKDVRCLLLQTWLVPFYDDFRWMRSASKELDRHSIENGLSNTILTLPLPWQQDIFLAWFDRFLNSGEDCPNIQRGFEVWWRRAFWRRKGHDQDHPYVRIVNVSSEDS